MSDALPTNDTRPLPRCVVNPKHGQLSFKGVHPDQDAMREHWKCDAGRCSIFYTRPTIQPPSEQQP